MIVQMQFELKDEHEAHHLEKFLERGYTIKEVKVLPTITNKLKADPAFRYLEWKNAQTKSDMNRYIKENNS